MKKIVFALACAISTNALAERAEYDAPPVSLGFMYHKVLRHVKIKDVPNPYGAGSYSTEFDVSNSRYGVFDSTGTLMSALAGAANQETARRKAIEDAYIPKGQTSTTVSYSWTQPHYVDTMAYIAMYGSADATGVNWSYSSDWDKFFAYPKGGASMSGLDIGAPLPSYTGLNEKLGITIAPVWELNYHKYTFGGTNDSVIADPLSLNVLYQSHNFPWVAGQVHVSWAPIMGLMGALFSGLPQMYGYGFGVQVPLGAVTLEANYDKFNGAFMGGTGSKGTPVESSAFFIGGKLDVVKAFYMMFK